MTTLNALNDYLAQYNYWVERPTSYGKYYLYTEGQFGKTHRARNTSIEGLAIDAKQLLLQIIPARNVGAHCPLPTPPELSQNELTSLASLTYRQLQAILKKARQQGLVNLKLNQKRAVLENAYKQLLLNNQVSMGKLI